MLITKQQTTEILVMSFYELINKQFSELNLEIDFKKLDILEYMVLERGGCLNALKSMPLKCVFLSGHTSNVHFEDGYQRSSIQLGFHSKVDEVTERRLRETLRKIRPKFSEYTYDYEHQYYNHHNTRYAFILLDKDIECAIKSSSLFIAAGDLSKLDLTALLELKENISLYKINDSSISDIVDRLTNKISQHIESTFNNESIHIAFLSVSNKFKAKQNILNQEQKFNDLFFELNNHINYLKKKGTPKIQGNVWTAGEGVSYVPNPDFVPEYENIASAAGKLQTTLEKAREDFFNNPPSEKSLKQFQDTCYQAIEEAKTEFTKHPGIWDQLHPILKGILGVIAAITIIPAIIIQVKSPRGFIGTFFEAPKANSLIKLELFEKEVCSDNGVFDEMERATNIIKMN